MWTQINLKHYLFSSVLKQPFWKLAWRRYMLFSNSLTTIHTHIFQARTLKFILTTHLTNMRLRYGEIKNVLTHGFLAVKTARLWHHQLVLCFVLLLLIKRWIRDSYDVTMVCHHTMTTVLTIGDEVVGNFNDYILLPYCTFCA